MAILRAGIETLAHAQVGSPVELAGEEAHHLARVRRAEIGTVIEALDGRGTAATLTIDDIRKQGKEGWLVVCRVNKIHHEPRPKTRLEVWAAPPKGDRLPQMVEQLSQAGACAYIPLETSRGVAEAGDAKLERLRRIAHESIKQCGRAWAMEIGEPAPSKAAFTDGALVLVTDAAGQPLGPPPADAPLVRVLIGPEGGFTPEELNQFDQSGGTRATLGPHVMRTETAAVAAAVILRAR